MLLDLLIRQIITTAGKYKAGDPMPTVYLRGKPSEYTIDIKKAYWAMLIFYIILLLLVVFAGHKINWVVQSGQM